MLTKERIYEIYDKEIKENPIDRKKTPINRKILNWIGIILIIIIEYKILSLPFIEKMVQEVGDKIFSMNAISGISIFFMIMPLIPIIIIVPILLWYYIIKNIYRDNFNERMINKILEICNEELKYMPGVGISSEEYIRQAEFEKFNAYESSNLIIGTLKNKCNIELAQIIGYDIVPSIHGYRQPIIGSGDKYHEIFNGFLAKIKFPIDFDLSLYLRKDIKNRLEKEKFRESKIKFDSEEFERIFNTYSLDAERAKQLLNKDLIKKIVDFYNELEKLIEITIKKRYIYIKFETSKIDSISKENFYTYYKVLNFICDFTNELINAANNG